MELVTADMVEQHVPMYGCAACCPIFGLFMHCERIPVMCCRCLCLTQLAVPVSCRCSGAVRGQPDAELHDIPANQVPVRAGAVRPPDVDPAHGNVELALSKYVSMQTCFMPGEHFF
jgi:hypothetical protein